MLYLPPDVFSVIFGEFLATNLYRCFLESVKSENWYRLQAMEGASAKSPPGRSQRDAGPLRQRLTRGDSLILFRD